jgi:hypothetical protein
MRDGRIATIKAKPCLRPPQKSPPKHQVQVGLALVLTTDN